ncbi:MAG: ral nucleoside transport system permease protein [Thermomicrobiales bacterium]|nr:ral nucleoside transport system permease protein [Thermomicrobiales bacterium]
MADIAVAGRRLRFERVLTPSRAATILVPFLSILLALITCGVLLLLSGENPFEVYRAMLRGSLGDRFGVAETLVKAIPLLLTGLGVSIAFRMQLWNIGAEGQFYLGAIAATGTALYLFPSWPSALLIPAMMIAGLIGGAIWGFIPGVLRAYLGANETITSLMLNYVAILFADYLVLGPWKNPQGFGFPGTKPFPDASYLPHYGTYRVHLGLLFGLVAALLLWIALRRTRWGYELSVMGENPRAARYAGMRTRQQIVVVLALSGALAGLAGMSEVGGIAHQLQRNLSPGYGYTAIIVAWLARLNPFGIVGVSFLLAAVLVGGDQLQLAVGLPSSVAPMLQGAILFFLLGGEVLTRYRISLAPQSGAPPGPLSHQSSQGAGRG